MPVVKFPYGKEFLELDIPESRFAGVMESHMHEYKPAGTPDELVRAAMANPIGTPTLAVMAEGKKKVVVICSDHTRPVPSKVIIPPMLEEIRKGSPDADITLLISTGCHRATTEEELVNKFGEDIVKNEKIVVHDCDDTDNLVYLGKLPSGGDLIINKLAAEADLLVAEGFIEPHFFAGFSGGRKSILPGISGMETICHNHAYSLDPACLMSNPRIGNGKVKDNPLNDDMCEAAAMVPQLYMVNLVMNAEMQLAEIYAGHYLTSWQKACEAVDRIYRVKVPEKADAIIASCGGFPKDMSLYQGTKTIDNVETGLKPGGTLILLIEARDGGGPAEYFGWIDDLLGGTMEKRLREHFTVPGYIFLLNCEQAHRYNILMLTSVPQETVAPMGLKAFSDVDELMKAAHLEGKSLYVIPNGSTVVPYVKEKK